MEGIFNPKSIAVIGASTRAGSIGNQVMLGLLADKYQGKIYPINPTAPEVTLNFTKSYVVFIIFFRYAV